MGRKIWNRKGQNMAEYAIIFGVVIAAAMGISALIKEGIQDRVVSEVRKLSDNEATGNAVFDIVSNVTRNRVGSDNTAVALGGAVTERATTNIISTSNETYNVGQ